MAKAFPPQRQAPGKSHPAPHTSSPVQRAAGAVAPASLQQLQIIQRTAGNRAAAAFVRNAVGGSGPSIAQRSAVPATPPPTAVEGPFAGLAVFKKACASYTKGATDELEGGDTTEKVAEGAVLASGISEDVSGGVNDLAKQGGGEGDKVAEAAGNWSGTVGSAIETIKNVYGTFKEAATAYKKWQTSKADAAAAGLAALKNLLSACQSAMKMVKSIYEIMSKGAGALTQAIPGIGVAISAVSIMIKGYEIWKAGLAKEEMTAVKAAFKEKYKNSAFIKKGWKKDGTDKEKLKLHKEQLENEKATASDSRKADIEIELAEIREYQLAKEMKYINQKRQDRAGLGIASDVISMAGDISTLSGAGAAATVPLKAAAAGLSGGATAARTIKQAGRDRASKQGAWKVTKWMFNAEKSSEQKHQKRVSDMEYIFDLAAKLPDYEDSEQVNKQYGRVQSYISSTGLNPDELYAANGDFKKQRKLILEAMKKRD